VTVSVVELSPAADLAALPGGAPAQGANTPPADGAFQALFGALLGELQSTSTQAAPPTEGPASGTPGTAQPKGDGDTAAAALESLVAMAWLPAAPVAPPVTLNAATNETGFEGTAQAVLGVEGPGTGVPAVPVRGSSAITTGPGTPGAIQVELPAAETPALPPSEQPAAAPPAPGTPAKVASTANGMANAVITPSTAPAMDVAVAVEAAPAVASEITGASGPRRRTATEPANAIDLAPMGDLVQDAERDDLTEATSAPDTNGVVRSDGNATVTNAQPAVAGAAQAPDLDLKIKATPGTEVRGIEGVRPQGSTPTEQVAEAAQVAEPRPAQPLAPTEQVARAVIERVSEGGGEAVIRLDPAELGHVRIHVSTTSEGVRVEVHAERPEAVALLRSSTPDLSSLLNGQGLDLSSVYVGLGGREAGGNARDGAPWAERGQHPADGEFASILGIGDTGSVERHNRLRSAYNPDGALLYRV